MTQIERMTEAAIPESHRSVAALRRHKLHITRPAVNGRSRSFRCASSPLKIFDFAGTPFFGGESWHGHILFGRSFSCLLRQSLIHFFGQIEKPIYTTPCRKDRDTLSKQEVM